MEWSDGTTQDTNYGHSCSSMSTRIPIQSGHSIQYMFGKYHGRLSCLKLETRYTKHVTRQSMAYFSLKNVTTYAVFVKEELCSLQLNIYL